MYYPYPACIPFLSSFYPLLLASGYCQRRLEIDKSFVLFSLFILLHFLGGSLLTFYTFIHLGMNQTTALFGAISLSYSAYFVKPFTPCAMYSMAWMPGVLLGGWKGAVCLGMSILGGYWPITIFASILLFFAPSSWWGILIGLPQIIPTLWYWPKSIRSHAKFNPNFGKVPLWRYLDFVLPNRTQNTLNGVLWPEMALFCGIIALIAIQMGFNFWWPILMLALFLKIQRIPARSLYLLTFSLVMIAVQRPIGIGLLFLQAFLLLLNRDLYPHFPFCQWWQNPSEMFKDAPLNTKWPYFTGYIQGKMIEPYWGGFCLKENAKEDSYVGFR